MFKRILFPTDLSPESDEMLKSINLKKLGTEEIVLIHVVALMYSGISQEFQENDRKELEERKKFLEKKGYKVSVRVPIGVPFSEIIRTTNEEDISLIVIGIHELGMIEEALMGSLAERIIRNTKKPILIYRFNNKNKKEKAKKQIKNNTFKKILYPTDWSECANYVIPYINKMKPSENKEIVILHVIDERELRHSTKAQIQKIKEKEKKQLDKIKREFKNKSVKISTRIRTGVPYYIINKTAKDEDVTVVMLGSHGRGFIKEMKQGSTSEKVVRFGTTPVLIVNHQDGKNKES